MMQEQACVPSPPTQRHRRSKSALAERICTAVADGDALHVIVAREHMTLKTLRRWLAEDDDFRARYERAQATWQKMFADDVVAIADAAAGTTPSGARLRIAARKWFVAQAARAETRTSGGNKEKERAKALKARAIAELTQLEEILTRTWAEERKAAAPKQEPDTTEDPKDGEGTERRAYAPDGEETEASPDDERWSRARESAPKAPPEPKEKPTEWYPRFDLDVPEEPPPYDPLTW